jgi:hypothetical protein
MPDTAQLLTLIGIVAVLLGQVVPVLIQMAQMGRKDRADAKLAEAQEQKTRVEANQVIVDGWKDICGEKEDENARLRRDVDGLMQGIITLINQMRKAGLTPEWLPYTIRNNDQPARPDHSKKGQ